MIAYVDAAGGNDANSGDSPGQAWRTLARASREVWGPGDQVRLRRGSRWPEGIRLMGRGSKKHPITLGAYGDGPRPRIDGGDDHAIAGRGPISAWRIEGLELTSANARNPTRKITGGTCGVFVAQEEVCEGLTIVDCAIHDTSGPGIYLLAAGGPKPVFPEVVIENCEISNASCGIQFLSRPTYAWDYFPRFRIARCTVHDIGGDGIVPFCSRDGVVEHCTAYRTGLGVAPEDHSPVAIWYAWAQRCTIQFCEAYDNHTGGHPADGGGFDLDGGCEDCVLQYNYSHDNDGAGYLICSWDPQQWPCTGAVCRYSLSVNDGLANDYSSVLFWQSVDCRVYNNTCLTRTASPLKFTSDTRGHLIANNIFSVQSPEDVPVVKSAFDISRNRFRNNLFHRGAGGLRFEIQGRQILSLREFDALVGAEGQIEGDPGLVGAAAGDVHLRPDSPCRGGGVRVDEGGGRDYYGAHVPESGPVDIGCAAAG